VEPEGALHVAITAPSVLSLAVTVYRTEAPDGLAASTSIGYGGTVIVGGVLSCTFMINVALAVLPAVRRENISYAHIEKLGGRRNNLDIKENSRNNDHINAGWKNKSFRAYAGYMATTSFKEDINELLSLMKKYSNLAIMCAEADPGVVIEE
jgi:uncharacterized protein DUF488